MVHANNRPWRGESFEVGHSSAAVAKTAQSHSYCRRQRDAASWPHGKRILRLNTNTSPFTSPDTPSRCPAPIIVGKVQRCQGVMSDDARSCFASGQPFVADAEDLIGHDSPLLRWDLDYLAARFPPTEKFGVMMQTNRKIVMSHAVRYGQDKDKENEQSRNGNQNVAVHGEGEGGEKARSADQYGTASEDTELAASKQQRMTMRDFVAAARLPDLGVGQPYPGVHLLWRDDEKDNGNLGPIGQPLAADLGNSINFRNIKRLQDQDELPLVKRLYLFVGVKATLYHCHYDFQPNLHVQLVGRKRFIIFPPDDWQALYPFPTHHNLDRRSRVDLDAPDTDRFPKWTQARGLVAELEPGEVLFLPPYWWHHVQTMDTPTTSIAMWFFEELPKCRTKFAVNDRSADIRKIRCIEEYIAACSTAATSQQLNQHAGKDGASWDGPAKAATAAHLMKCVVRHLDGEALPAKELAALVVPFVDVVATVQAEVAEHLGDAVKVGEW